MKLKTNKSQVYPDTPIVRGQIYALREFLQASLIPVESIFEDGVPSAEYISKNDNSFNALSKKFEEV
eukprot:CAMPEP_0117425206 /NCGR_PEP_ID=MMETSP0758-20121206/5510_1 /TAXON_ID=63605 /ORGANISM="Percolomonas cosmopolitus, Strain AE-1 (ATCC 50343)" /LENGTH=66 /DNA_ID=CAMNT_0005209523 /DNA_START=212 /DNA_END=409 /DNA_ORIENTATION=-